MKKGDNCPECGDSILVDDTTNTGKWLLCDECGYTCELPHPEHADGSSLGEWISVVFDCAECGTANQTGNISLSGLRELPDKGAAGCICKKCHKVPVTIGKPMTGEGEAR